MKGFRFWFFGFWRDFWRADSSAKWFLCFLDSSVQIKYINMFLTLFLLESALL
ncbi:MULTISPECIES: hypothetical protein [unclassified Helicobacter]|uniref:hypothetical protein n=1 Tax=unclassified Helicobacter TaxID=2593540 RepID=UPI0012E7D588|nr:MULTISPECIES: hypothetical protein [unclassified Helicobacter]